jgi:formylglycine-generating enzyme required for sulfatase activity
MGSPENEPGRLSSEEPRPVAIDRPFAISSTLTTIDQFSQFDGGGHAKRLPPDFREPGDKPVVWATWFEAAKYCNWLSKCEGIPESQWCYITDERGDVVGVHPDYLDRAGYRLPTDAEVEYANRATTRTCRYYGETEDLLGEYAWYAKNSGEVTQPVGRLKPNDFGLFDMQGNAFTWCHDRVWPADGWLARRVLGVAGEWEIDATEKRVLRGAAFYFVAKSLRAARRHDDVPTMRGFYYGFRVAKTLK